MGVRNDRKKTTAYEHSFRRGRFASERTYRLGADRLEWSAPRGRGDVAYRDIETIRVYQTRTIGVGDQTSALRWRCVLYPRSGGHIVLAPDHYLRFGRWEDRQSSFAPFANELIARISAANPHVRRQNTRPRSFNIDRAAGILARMLLSILRRIDSVRAGHVAARLMRLLGPLLPEHRLGRANLIAAFPDKAPANIEKILSGVWDNLGRVGAEYASLDRIWDSEPGTQCSGRIVIDAPTRERIAKIARDGKPVLIFAAHLANWELPALAAVAQGTPLVVPIRRQHIGPLAEAVVRSRSGKGATYIATDRLAPFRIKGALRRGACVAILVDQHAEHGLDVVFFGRRCQVSPLLARLARMFELPIHGARTIRLPDQRFRFEFTDALDAPRDASGKIDVHATMQAITFIVERWVREHPEQWLWLHRRWR
jgi:KDO2-lipid IV(A) lauroyltransferase